MVYKIASSALAMRLKSVLGKLIAPAQTGFMSGRFIGENIHLIYDIMHYTEEKDIPGLLMLIDFQKAFDTISWSFLDTTLKFFGFKEEFCKWMKVLIANITASVLQFGTQSGRSHISIFVYTLLSNNVPTYLQKCINKRYKN